MSQIDRFATYAPSWQSPPTTRRAVTPSDIDDIGFTTTSLHVTGAGTVRAITADGSEVTFTAAAGEDIPGQFRRVMLTGTTATGIFASN